MTSITLKEINDELHAHLLKKQLELKILKKVSVYSLEKTAMKILVDDMEKDKKMDKKD